MEKVKVTLDGYDPLAKYQLFLRVNNDNGVTTGYTCTSSNEYTYNRKSPGPRPVEKIEIRGLKFNDYIDKGILSDEDFPEMESSDVMWIAECGMVVIHIAGTEKDFIIYDLLHVSDKNFDSIQQPENQTEYDDIDASFRHYVIDVVNGVPQPLMISDNMFYINADKVDVTYDDNTTEQLIRPSNDDLTQKKIEVPDGYNEAVFTSTKENPAISAIYLYGGNNTAHKKTIDGNVTATRDETTADTGYIKYTFSGTGAISLW